MELNKSTIIISVISLALIFGFLYLVYFITNQPKAPVMSAGAQTVEADDHVKWSPAKKHLLVEYSDLQCPACKAFHTMIKSSIENDPEITKNITFVYRHFPLSQAHPYAYEAAYAAEAAGNQNKFFEMTDLMFETQDSWKDEGNSKGFFNNLAKQLKLDEEKFKADMASSEVRNRVSKDYQSGIVGTVNSTPTFYLDGEKLVNITSFDDFKKLLQETAKAK